MAKFTEDALDRLKDLTSQNSCIRLFIQRQTCSGPLFSFSIKNDFNEELDEKEQQKDLTIIYLKEQAQYFRNMTIDYNTYNGYIFGNNEPRKCCGGSCHS